MGEQDKQYSAGLTDQPQTAPEWQREALAALRAWSECPPEKRPSSAAPSATPVAWRYRWKIDGEWTSWRVADASQKSQHLKDLEEVPLYAAPPSRSSAGTVEVPTDALINLVNYQEQCDEDGVMVKVSRQALAEVLLYVQLVRPDLNGGPQTATEGQTPAAKWRVQGHPDPHRTRYDCERAQLAGGSMTDDEVANLVYLDPSIENLTIAKDRIRWLSRQLVQALALSRPDGK